MKKFLLLFNVLIIGLMITANTFSQTTGDFRSAASGVWFVAATWESFDGTNWVTAATTPGSTTNVTIRSGHTISFEASSKAVNKLIIDAGGAIVCNGSSASPKYLNLYDSLINNGSFGLATDDGLGVKPYNTNAVLTGTGNYYICRFQPQTAGQTVTFDANITFQYSGSSGTGGSAVYANGKEGVNLVINAGKTITIGSNANFTVGTGSGSDGANGMNVTVNGTLTFTPSGSGSNFSLRPGVGKVYNLMVNGTVNLASDLLANGGGTANITINNGGVINHLSTGRNVDISGDSTNIAFVGTGKINLGANTLLLGKPFSGTSANLSADATSSLKLMGTVANINIPGFINSLNALELNNSFGTTLQGPLSLAKLTLKNGNLVTSTYTLTLRDGGSISGEDSARYVIGKLVTTQTVLADSVSSLGGVGVALGAGIDNLGDVTVTRVSGINGEVTIAGKSGIARRWTVTSSNPPTNGRDLSFTWVKDDDNGKDMTKATIYKSNDAGVHWFAVGTEQNIVVDTLRTRTIKVNTTSFSDWTVSDDANALPVELVTFSASVSGKDIVLSWKTATELNNRGWDVERENTNSKSWVKVGFVNGVGTTLTPNNYSFTDKNVTSGKYLYRLKQVDNDGTSTYGKTVEVDFQGKPLTYALDNYPNPFNPETKIRFEIPVTSFVNVSVYNVLGEKVATLVNESMEQGVYEKSFGANNLTSGVYIYKLSAGSYTITKKMMLTK
ncbi:MAG: T9SS type A sorting domain-containing protein [Ignavibacteria bacterium]|nr:T9SS type A sorting domain-containing protein [Ignavibacteria bacterium]